ncbi:MAG: M20 family metallo-hydrolase [Muribaculaceae bacterium]|nr:M20 family metallo-hydrolase [Muribaculaceae bacterium]
MCDPDDLYYDAVDLLRELISIPRVSRQENKAADAVERFMSRTGLEPRRHGNNVWSISRNFDSSRPTLLLNSHIDTVKPVAGWTRDPYNPEVEPDSGRLYGIGSNDAGASLVSLLAAYRCVRDSETEYNIIFLASAEEEVSGTDGISSVLPMLPVIDTAIVGEPTGMNPAIAEKGLMVLDGVVRGRSGHAARNEGVNAIYKALPVIERLQSLELPCVSDMLGPIKISVTQIAAGTQHNVVPDECRIVVDVRTTDAYSNESTLEMIRAAVPECELKPRSTRLQPSGIDAGHRLVQRLVMMGKEPFGSPTLSDQALLRCESVKVGPGDSARSHTADEYIVLDEIREAIELYIRMISPIAAGQSSL